MFCHTVAHQSERAGRQTETKGRNLRTHWGEGRANFPRRQFGGVIRALFNCPILRHRPRRQIEKGEKRKAEIDKLIPEEKENERKAVGEIEGLKEALAKEKTNAENLDRRIKELSAKLIYENKSAAADAKEELKSKAEALEKSRRKAKEEFDACDKNIAAVKSRIEENQKLLADSDETDASAEEAKQEELKKEKDRLTRMQKEIHARSAANKSAYENIKLKYYNRIMKIN